MRRDLAGLKFGLLTVQEYEPEKARWKCTCDCGTTAYVLGSNLISGHTKSCGCLRKNEIVGTVIDRLTVLSEIMIDGKKHYKVRCVCGNEEIRSYDSLRQTTAHKMCRQCAKALRAKAVSATFDNGTQPSAIKLDKTPTKANRSGVVGVNWDKSRNLWQASLRFRGHKYNLGRFASFKDAVEARKKAEREIFEPYIRGRLKEK